MYFNFKLISYLHAEIGPIVATAFCKSVSVGFKNTVLLQKAAA